ncbi:MAG: hypothetical protein A2474_08120 [Elusimicrobia bacterium RIFOXYC2_FULL_34_12]|nr:MAG: hypothetical protein A2474_08120 [Elusimicrobia bacterium RIFOXYC2_FULL_34_12]OGS39449.1 MAG: hypothetical protein A2551_07610 [Elusimicrobia bacterium RIFOXYD2_FULL_34_30]HAM39729.1 hypothetical protein [Elusimicrobiota bacterium]
MIEKIIFFTNCQKILSFLAQNPDKEYFDRKISNLSGVSRAGTNFALRDLAKAGLVSREKRGRMYFYKVLAEDTFIKHFKILQNIIIIYHLVLKIKELSLKIVLFGSAGKGENTDESDVDIFIMTRSPDEIKKIIFEDKLREKIQYIINTPNEYIKLKKDNSIFYKEIEKGITLWQTK